MACPFCATTAPQKRADGRCVSCGKLLPEESRGCPDPLPTVASPCTAMMSGDSLEWPTALQPGDIVALLQLHRGKFALRYLTPAEAADFPGPKYIVPANWGNLGVFFTLNGWQEYEAPPPPKPWWRFW